METFTDPTVLFGVAVLIAIIIERSIEILKSIYDMIDSSFNFHLFWTKRAGTIAKKLENRLKTAEIAHIHLMARILNTANKIILKTKDGESLKTPVISGDLVRRFHIKLYSKILGVIIGIIITFFTRIDLLSIWEIMNVASERSQYTPSFFGILLTGIITGLGADTLHKVIIGMELFHKIKKKKGFEA